MQAAHLAAFRPLALAAAKRVAAIIIKTRIVKHDINKAEFNIFVLLSQRI